MGPSSTGSLRRRDWDYSVPGTADATSRAQVTDPAPMDFTAWGGG